MVNLMDFVLYINNLSCIALVLMKNWMIVWFRAGETVVFQGSQRVGS
jgi:hypothetical protein